MELIEMDKKKIKFTINSIYPTEHRKECQCCEGSCEKTSTKIVLLEVGNIIIMVRLCDEHSEYLEGMKNI